MAQPRLDDALLEYTFSEPEKIQAMFLNASKIAYYQTLYSKYFKLRGTMPVPEGKELEYQYIKDVIMYDGKMAMIQELLDNHKEAVRMLAERKVGEVETSIGTGADDAAATVKANKLVHIPSV
jgi:hypothetical protein